MWRKGLERVRRLAARDTHSFVLAPLCATIPIMDELCRCSCNCNHACLASDCSLISFVARQVIFYSRWASPLGRNAHFWCTRYGGQTQDILLIKNNYINYRVTSNLPGDIRQTVGFLCELCFFAWCFINVYVFMSLVTGHYYLINIIYRDWVLCPIVCCNYVFNFHIVHWCCT